MPQDADRDRFVARIEARRRWAWRAARLRRLAGASRPMQAMVYDATFRDDAEAVAFHYAVKNDHLPDLETPVWLNEKVRWQFLHHPNPLMSLAADKLAVRDYLAWVGASVAAPGLIACGLRPDDLPVADLPERFVLKSTYGSGQVHIEDGRRTVDRAALRDMVAGWAGFDQWRHTGELHYRGLPKRWLVEEYVEARRRKYEYKVFCTLGEPVFVMVITERDEDGRYRRALYDLSWRPLAFTTRGIEPDPRPVPRPEDLERVLEEARRLSADFLHVRVDFMKFDDRLVFSELTFASLAARIPYEPLMVNAILGEMMDLRHAPELLRRGRRIVAELQGGAGIGRTGLGAAAPVAAEEARRERVA
jgi:hypothetical protein